MGAVMCLGLEFPFYSVCLVAAVLATPDLQNIQLKLEAAWKGQDRTRAYAQVFCPSVSQLPSQSAWAMKFVLWGVLCREASEASPQPPGLSTTELQEASSPAPQVMSQHA